MAWQRRKPKYVWTKPEKPPSDPPTTQGFIEIARRAVNLKECRMLWANAKDMDLLTDELREVLNSRAAQLKTQQERNNP